MEKPDAIVTEIARRAGVDPSLLYRWRRQLARRREAPTFVPVRVAEEPEPACAPAPAPARAMITSLWRPGPHDDRRGAGREKMSTVMGALAARGWQG